MPLSERSRTSFWSIRQLFESDDASEGSALDDGPASAELNLEEDMLTVLFGTSW